MQLLRQPISASDWILDRFYVISMEFLSLSHRRNVPSGEEQETDVFAGYSQPWLVDSESQILRSGRTIGKTYR